MGPREADQVPPPSDEDDSNSMAPAKRSSDETGEMSSGSAISRSNTSLVNLADESISRRRLPPGDEESSNHAISGESSLTPVQWEAWSLPTETWGHYESATDLAGGSCQELLTTTTASTTFSEDESSSPPHVADIGRRMASLPNLAEAGRLTSAASAVGKKQSRKDTTSNSATGRRRKTATGDTPNTITTNTSIEQLKIRTLQSEIHRLQSQLLNLQTTHERTLKSSSRYKSKCTTLQAQLEHTQSENDHLRQEVQDLKTLVKLEEEARLVGAIDALWVEEDNRSATPPTHIQIEVPQGEAAEPAPATTMEPRSLLMNNRDSRSTRSRRRRRSLDGMELKGLERHDFTNRVA